MSKKLNVQKAECPIKLNVRKAERPVAECPKAECPRAECLSVPESGCRKCRGPKKGFLNAKVLMLDFRSRPVYLKTSLTRNGFTQISGTPSKPTLKARGAVTNFLAAKVHCFPVFCTKC